MADAVLDELICSPSPAPPRGRPDDPERNTFAATAGWLETGVFN